MDTPGQVQAGPPVGSGRPVDRFFRAVECALALLLVAMFVMVLGNVVLRYAFGTGIVVSEELSRLGLVWITFVGAVVAWRSKAHLGVDNFTQLLPPGGKWVCALLSELLTLLCCVVVVIGTWQQHEVSVSTKSLVTGLPMIWMYGLGYVAGGGIALLSLQRGIQLLTQGPRAAEEPATSSAEVVA